jgi:NCS1 family nucleobase:cation symporter-1
MFADYFLVRSRIYKLTHLYTSDPSSIYWYWRGLNWRAFASWVMGVWITLPGFAQRIQDPSVTLQGWSHMYYFSWPLGTVLSMATYCALCRIWQVEALGLEDEEDVFGTFGVGGVVEGIEAGTGSESASVEEVLVEKVKGEAV